MLIGPLATVVLGVILLDWSWRKWADPIVDFGSTVYTPWRLAEGEHLYQDIFFYYGPVAQYLNGFFFKLFGSSYATLIGINMAITALFSLGLWRLAASSAGRWTAMAAVWVFLGVFAFNQYLFTANYNFMSPYGPETTQGLLFSLGMILAMGRYGRTGGIVSLLLAGFCQGLVHLTKPDLSLAAAATGVFFSLYLLFLRRDVPMAKRIVRVVTFQGMLLVPVLISFLLLLMAMPAGKALWGTFGAWSLILTETDPIANNDFFLNNAGLNEFFPNLLKTVQAGAACLAATGAIAIVAAALGKTSANAYEGNGGKQGIVTQGATAILLLGGLVALAVHTPWNGSSRGFPMLLGVVLLLMLAPLVIGKAWKEDPPALETFHKTWLGPFLYGIFALALIPKFLLSFKIVHYGFYLALPVVTALIILTPAAMRMAFANSFSEGARKRFQLAGLVVAMMFTGSFFTRSYELYARKNEEIGTAPHTLKLMDPRIDGRTQVLQAIDGWARQNIPADSTMAVLPEGIYLNVLWQAPNPTPYRDLIHLAWSPSAEPLYLEAFRKAPPDYIVYLHRSTAEFGPAYFSKDFGLELAAWVEENYVLVAKAGAEPFTSNQFGMEIRQRRDLRTETGTTP